MGNVNNLKQRRASHRPSRACRGSPPQQRVRARQVYKDANHKPEMAIALTDFEALCGFVAHEELVAALAGAPELAACVGRERVAALRAAGGGGGARRAALREAFTALMLCDAGEVRAAAARGAVLGARRLQVVAESGMRAACIQAARSPGHAHGGVCDSSACA
jgi:hypothetical protein